MSVLGTPEFMVIEGFGGCYRVQGCPGGVRGAAASRRLAPRSDTPPNPRPQNPPATTQAPELYEEAYDEKVDIYSFGLCLLARSCLPPRPRPLFPAPRWPSQRERRMLPLLRRPSNAFLAHLHLTNTSTLTQNYRNTPPLLSIPSKTLIDATKMTGAGDAGVPLRGVHQRGADLPQGASQRGG